MRLAMVLMLFAALAYAEVPDLLTSTSPVVIPERSPAPGHATDATHRVWLWQETGDCLWNLAKKYYGDPWLWKKIYFANKDQIEDPGVIYPKQVLVIPPLEDNEK